MTTQTLRNGDGKDLAMQPGETMLVVAVTGSYSASIIAGTGAPSIIATDATGGSYGPYAKGAVVRLRSSALSEIDFDIGTVPVVVSDTPVMASTNPLTGGIEFNGVPFAARPTGNKIAILGNSIVSQAKPTFAGADAEWVKNNTYTASAFAGAAVVDLSQGYLPLRYQVTTAGTSGTQEPVWPTVAGGTVTDGSVIWTAVANTALIPFWPQSWWHYAQALSGQRLQAIFIVGRSGQTASDILQYVPRVLASNPDIVYFANIFENDCWPGSAPVFANVQAAWELNKEAMNSVRAAGKRVMTQTLLPSGFIDASSAFTGYVRGTGTQSWNWLNSQIRNYAKNNPDVIFFDAADVYADANPANPVWPENTTTYLSQAATGQGLKLTDGIHPNTAGGFRIAKSLAPILAANFAAVPRFSTAGNPDAVSVNPLNFGTSGTAGSGVTSGTPANLMTVNSYGATSSVLSKVARVDGAGEMQQITYAATAGDNLAYQPTTSTPRTATNFLIGDVVQGFQEIKYLANPTLLKQFNMRLDFVAGLPQYVLSGTDAGSNAHDIGQFISAETTFVVKTVPIKIPTGTTGFQTYAQTLSRGASSFTAQYGRSVIVKI